MSLAVFPRPSLARRVAALAAVVSVLFGIGSAVQAQIVPGEDGDFTPGNSTNVGPTNFSCGEIAGNLTVQYSTNVESYFGPVVRNIGAGNFNTILAGMTIEAIATPVAPFTGANWAWMQAVVGYNSPSQFQDPNGVVQTAPWPDTPPGGYWVSNFGQNPFGRQHFDSEPWYGNNQIRDLTLFDQPKVYISPNTRPVQFNFESWLVCVTDNTTGVPGNYTVLPLVGFTWGYTYDYGANDIDGDGSIGNILAEYTAVVNFGGITQAGQPSNAFKDGYDNYWNITYLNNPDDCPECLATQGPEPGSGILLLFMGVTGGGMFLTGMVRLKRVG